MEHDLKVKEAIIIPAYELDIQTSRAGGPGGQHVNKTSSRITVRWNLLTTSALNDQEKSLVFQRLAGQITTEGDIIIHNSASRSQLQNKAAALKNLISKIRQALHVEKKRVATRLSKSIKKARMARKAQRSALKKMRSKRFVED